MNECPVCRVTVSSSARYCDECGTPLGRATSTSGGVWARRLTPFFPGLSHLWMGHLFTGTLALYGSLIALFYLFWGGPFEYPELLFRILIWAGVWIVWSGAWTVHINWVRPRKCSGAVVFSYVLILLIIANLLSTFLLTYTFLSRSTF